MNADAARPGRTDALEVDQVVDGGRHHAFAFQLASHKRAMALQVLRDAQEHVDHYTKVRDQRLLEAVKTGCSYRTVGAAIRLSAATIHNRFKELRETT